MFVLKNHKSSIKNIPNLFVCFVTVVMGRHSQWRKIAKKERRRKIRINQARTKDGIINEESEDFQTWLKQQAEMEQLEIEQIKQANMVENLKWIEAEKVSIEQWKLLQKKKELMQQKHLEQQARIKMEYEIEQKRKKEEEERLIAIEEEKKKKQELFMTKLENFLSGDSADPPAELLISHETRPHLELCPFFSKTGCCRFGDQCSRNHQYPGISKVLMAPNFFVHFGLNNSHFTEYDTDIMLEYEDSDTYKEFVEFFNDVLPEFEKFGTITQFKVCNNYEKHLRGNIYIEYAELRCAVAAYRSLHTRWYGGRQLSLQFCLVDSWNNAICGLASKKRCPKGRACNFLHVFRNPNNVFAACRREPKRKTSSPSRSWRWSESPEPEINRKRRSKSIDRKYREENRKSKYDKEKYRTRKKHGRRRSPERRHN